MIPTKAISTTTIGARGRALMLAGFAAIGLGVVTPGSALAQPAPGPHMQHEAHGGNIEQRVDRMLKRVNATADQQAKVHAILQAAKADIAPLRASIRDSRKQLRILLSAPQIDTAAIETLRSQDSATIDKISVRVSAAIIEGANVLTPEQRARLATMAPRQRPDRPQ